MVEEGEELDGESPLEPEVASEVEGESEETILEALRKERDETADLLLRKQAEFENYRKRIRKEREEQRLAAQAAVFEELLPILDALEKGLESLREAPEDSELEAYRLGYQLIVREIGRVLDRFEVTEIPGLGTPFDPNIHEAVLREETTDHEEGCILDELRKGYKIRSRLLRPAQVRVAVLPDKEANDEEKAKE
ncbi:MAG: nucleotide exchange factor GrpE [Acidobacteriota bacterium]